MVEHGDWDVAILGGGLAGLSLGLQLQARRAADRIVIIEKETFPAPEAAHKVGESTVEIGAHYFAEVLGLREHLREEHLPKLGLRFFFPAGDNTRIEERFEIGAVEFPPTSSYQIDRGRLENFMAKRFVEAGGTLLDGTRVTGVAVAAEGQHQVRFSRDSKRSELAARWLVDASSRAGILKRALGLSRTSPHNCSSAWFRIKTKIDLSLWSSDPRWRGRNDGAMSRWFSTNHLMGRGYWVWLIPLGSGCTSVGIVVDEALHPLSSMNTFDKAVQWLERYEPQCAGAVKAHADQLMDFRVLKHYAHDCEKVFSAERWGMAGEAGVFLDPFYSPGSDFIAFSNTFLTSLIEKERSGEPIGPLATFYNDLYLSFYRNTALIYQDQYPLFGSQRIMTLKIVWDFAVYWTLLAYLFYHDKLCDLSFFASIRREADRIGALNSLMQRFFITWDRQEVSVERPGDFDLLSVDFLHELNRTLRDTLDDEQCRERLRRNTEKLERFAAEIVFAAESGTEAGSESGPMKLSDADRNLLSAGPSRQLEQTLKLLGVRP